MTAAGSFTTTMSGGGRRCRNNKKGHYETKTTPERTQWWWRRVDCSGFSGFSVRRRWRIYSSLFRSYEFTGIIATNVFIHSGPRRIIQGRFRRQLDKPIEPRGIVFASFFIFWQGLHHKWLRVAQRDLDSAFGSHHRQSANKRIQFRVHQTMLKPRMTAVVNKSIQIEWSQSVGDFPQIPTTMLRI